MENLIKPIALNRMSDPEVIIASAHALPVRRDVGGILRNNNGGLVSV
tara:strand:+ start:122 stop:262 length:141 start_codon:yes stop_codon:yes gene_type:complete